MPGKPPQITNLSFGADGTLTVAWSLDTFFVEQTAPTAVEFGLGVVASKMWAGAEIGEGIDGSYDVDWSSLRPYAGQILPGSVVYRWSDAPAGDQSAGFTVYIPPVGAGGAAKVAKHEPVLMTVGGRWPRTWDGRSLGSQNRMQINWHCAEPFTSASMTWGRVGGGVLTVRTETAFSGRHRAVRRVVSGRPAAPGDVVSVHISLSQQRLWCRQR